MANEPIQPRQTTSTAQTGQTSPQAGVAPQPTTISSGTSPAGAVSSGSVAAPTASVITPTGAAAPAGQTSTAPSVAAPSSPATATSASQATPAPVSTTGTPAQTPTTSSTGGVISATQTAAAQASTTHAASSTPTKESYPWYQFYKGSDGMHNLMMIAVIVIGYVIFAYSGYFIGTAVGRASAPVSPEVFCSAATANQPIEEVGPEDTIMMGTEEEPASNSAQEVEDLKSRSEFGIATDSGQVDDSTATEVQTSTSSATTKPPMR